MDRQILLHKLISEELARFQTMEKTFENRMESLPEGSLLDRNGHHYRAFSEKGRRYQIPIKDEDLISQLALRRHIKAGLPVIQKKTALYRNFLKKDTYYDPVKIHNGLADVYHSTMDPLLFPDYDIDPQTWQRETYEKNPMIFLEEHYTSEGVQVRSKSEALIGSTLEMKEIPYRYEPKLDCGNRFYYPDFQILLPCIRRLVYLEHFGKMDDPEYVKRTMEKLNDYQRHGLYLGFNFFFTWETMENPLNMRDVHEIVSRIQKLDSR